MGILLQDDKDFLVAVAACIVHAIGDPSLLAASIQEAQSGILSNTTIFKRVVTAEAPLGETPR